MCWRDNMQTSSIEIEGIRWANRCRAARHIRVGDQFTFGPVTEHGGHIVFHRILKPTEDSLRKRLGRFQDKTQVKFTHGDLSGMSAILFLGRQHAYTRFQLENGKWFYPFQK